MVLGQGMAEVGVLGTPLPSCLIAGIHCRSGEDPRMRHLHWGRHYLSCPAMTTGRDHCSGSRGWHHAIDLAAHVLLVQGCASGLAPELSFGVVVEEGPWLVPQVVTEPF